MYPLPSCFQWHHVKLWCSISHHDGVIDAVKIENIANTACFLHVVLL